MVRFALPFFRPKSHVKPGDLCWLDVPKGENFSHLSGRECEVLTGLNRHTFRCGGVRWAHNVDIIGEGVFFAATPEVLRKQLPPNTRLERWDECPFIPEKEPVTVTHVG